jgi:DNA mismatch repair protein MutL
MLLGASRIRLLDSHTVNQIAAGEVVERPASVVKELIENALDAGATRIEVELSESGRERIRVADDGCGMELEDLRAALQRHATSKIASAEDLEKVRTLGFRGEALPSIASVSRMTLSTGTRDGLRHMARVVGGTLEEPAASAGPPGTEALVEDLFFNTPARLKFLKSDATELGQCLDVVSRFAIGYPQVAFLLTHDGSEMLRTDGTGDRLAAIAGVWGRETARGLAEVEAEIGGLSVAGFVSPPHLTRPTRAQQFVFVNGRPVRSRTLTAAVDQAYRSLTPERRFPILALALEIAPDRVDVNVSPTKSEVKFQSEGLAFEAIRCAVRDGLMRHGMMPSADRVAQANEALAAASAEARGGAAWVFPAAIAAQAPLMPNSAEMALGRMAGEAPSRERFPFAELLDGLKIVGQAMDTFIVAETRRGIVIVDQHVAHERILYEYLCGLRGASAIEVQRLLAPETVHLDRRLHLALSEQLDELARVGFQLEPFGGDSFVLRAAPAALRGKDPGRVLREIAEELAECPAQKLEPLREQIWITTACRMAVKAGDPLSRAEMERLIVDLASTENPYLCPHGRPITITLGTDELMRKFKRA